MWYVSAIPLYEFRMDRIFSFYVKHNQMIFSSSPNYHFIINVRHYMASQLRLNSAVYQRHSHTLSTWGTEGARCHFP